MKEYDDKCWHVYELVPDIIVCHPGIMSGEPTIKGTRVSTNVAGMSYEEGNWRSYHLKREQAYAAMCFEAGREFHRSRSLQKLIDKAVREGYEKYYQEHPIKQEVSK